MITKRWFTLRLVSAFVLVFPFAAPAAGVTDDPILLAAIRFRTEFGLRSDIAYVQALVEDPTAVTDWGLPLTSAEQAEMDRRRALAAGMNALNRYAASIPRLGSVYFDQRAGGEIVVAIAGDPEPYRDDVAARVPPTATFRMRQVEHSLSELNTLQDRITADRPDLSAVGIEVNAIIIDEVGNVVEVGVSDLEDSKRLAIESRYGAAMVRVFGGGQPTLTDTGCTSRGHCYGPPLRGGINVGNSGCSTAFVVNQSGVRRILTAGHSPCGNFSGSAWTAHNATGYYFGSIRSRSWFGGDTSETGDAATIGNLTSTQDDNRVYRTASSSWTISSAQTGDNFGIPVCLSGRVVDAVRCGSLVRTDASICFAEGCLREQREATYAIFIGDSGGAVFDGGAMAMGVQSSCVDRTGDNACSEGDTPDNALYGHIRNVFAELGGSMTIYTGD